MTECIKCQGEGEVIDWTARPPKIIYCPHCKDVCPRCKGTGRVKNHFGPLPWDDCPDCAGKE
jgi:DnaJ-class molecular chaperone